MVVAEDSLVVVLPDRITRQEVQIHFSTYLENDNTLFEAAVALGEGVWQQVDPETRDALVVRLPLFGEADELIHNLRISPAITPNGDGINDRAVVVFTVGTLQIQQLTITVLLLIRLVTVIQVDGI